MSEHIHEESDEERAERMTAEARLKKITTCLGAIAAGDKTAGENLTVEEIGVEGVRTLKRARDGKLEAGRGLWI